MEESQLIVGAATDPGTVRDRNEDRVHHAQLNTSGDAADIIMLLAVADGMGGHDRGDVASKMAMDVLIERLDSLDTDDASLILKQAYRRANEQIYEDGSARGEDSVMGTTLVAALTRGSELTIANVGDSRAYLIRAGAMTQVTDDHSLIAEQVRMGVLSDEEAKTAQHKNIITRALGHRPRVDVDIFELTLLPDDRLLISTDGVHDFMPETEIQDIVTSLPPDEAPQELIARALSSGSTDNVTALCAWMAPLSALVPVEPVVDEPGDRMALLIPILVGVVLVVLIAIILLLVLV